MTLIVFVWTWFLVKIHAQSKLPNRVIQKRVINYVQIKVCCVRGPTRLEVGAQIVTKAHGSVVTQFLHFLVP